MNAKLELPQLDTAEDVMDALTVWLRVVGKAREMKIEVTSIGLECKLFERGTMQAMGRGTSVDGALADALEDL